jgi:hypothetical protein
LAVIRAWLKALVSGLVPDTRVGMTFGHEFTVAVIPICPANSVVDVGEGEGVLLQEVLRQHQNARGILVDAPAVVERAEERYRLQKGMDRCEFYGGDIFSDVPAGADVYLLKHVLHDWEDRDCVRIINNCRLAMSATSRLVIIETLMGSVHSRHHAWRDGHWWP